MPSDWQTITFISLLFLLLILYIIINKPELVFKHIIITIAILTIYELLNTFYISRRLYATMELDEYNAKLVLLHTIASNGGAIISGIIMGAIQNTKYKSFITANLIFLLATYIYNILATNVEENFSLISVIKYVLIGAITSIIIASVFFYLSRKVAPLFVSNNKTTIEK